MTESSSSPCENELNEIRRLLWGPYVKDEVFKRWAQGTYLSNSLCTIILTIIHSAHFDLLSSCFDLTSTWKCFNANQVPLSGVYRHLSSFIVKVSNSVKMNQLHWCNGKEGHVLSLHLYKHSFLKFC